MISNKSGKNTLTVTLACLTGSLMFGFSGNYWSCSLSAKGSIYIFQIILELTLLFFLLSHYFNKNFKTRININRDLFFLFFLFSLGLANHWPTQSLLIPAFVFLLWKSSKPSRTPAPNVKIFLTFFSFFLIVASLYVYLPLRANQFPLLNFGEPNTLRRFLSSVSRLNYVKTEALIWAGAGSRHILLEKANYLSDHLLNEFHPATWLFFAIGVVFFIRQKEKNILLFFLTTFLTTLFMNLFYLQAMRIEFWHMDDHLLTINWIIGLMAGLGIFFTLTLFNKPEASGFSLKLQKKFIFIFVFTLPYLIFKQHLPLNDQTKEFLFRGYGLTGLKSMEKNSVYFAESDYDYFSILYLKEVEGKRPDTYLFLTPFLEKGYQYGLIEKNQPGLIPPDFSLPQKSEISEDSFFQNLETGKIHHPFYCAFSNGPFVELYLKHNPSFQFQPSGILIEALLPGKQSVVYPINILDDFWERYLGTKKRTANPINGLFLGICSHSFTNAANFLRLKGDMTQWDPLYNRALTLIPTPKWKAETWEQRAEGDFQTGNKDGALKAYVNSAFEFWDAGQAEGAIRTLKKALILDPASIALRQMLKSLENSK